VIERLAIEIRDIVEGLHGRGKPHVAVIIVQVVCSDGKTVAWKAKVKRGRVAIAKCCPSSTHWTPVDALDELVASTRRALGVLR
jgi:hypothetical protein